MSIEEETLAAAEAARALIRERVERSRSLAAEARIAADELRGATVTESTPQRDVSVTADAAGVVQQVRITDAAYDRSPDDLGRTITEVIRRAQRVAAERATDALAERLGTEAALVSELRAQTGRRFGEDAGRGLG